jgi:hypothetical protein
MRGQVNDYCGVPPRPLLRLRLLGSADDIIELEAVVDTGSPLAIVVDMEVFFRFARRETRTVPTNFGNLTSGWVRMTIPQTRFNHEMRVYGSDTVVHSVQQSDRWFTAVIGLPLLRMFEFGGDADRFWIRDASR